MNASCGGTNRRFPGQPGAMGSLVCGAAALCWSTAAGQARSTSSPSDPDPCALVTPAEAAVLTGERLNPPVRTPLDEGLEACFWYSVEQGRGMLAIYAGVLQGDGTIQKQYEEAVRSGRAEARQEPGLGDEAMSFTLPMMGVKLAQVNARRGRQVIMVQLRRRGPEAGGSEDRARAVRAAALALGRLEGGAQ